MSAGGAAPAGQCETPPPGLVARVRAFLSALALLPGVLVLAAWMVGNLCSDRWYWSQWLEWIPTSVALAGSGVFLSLAGLLHPRGTRDRRPSRARALSSIAWGLVLVYMLLVDWRLPNAFKDRERPGPGSTRVLFWNAAAEDEPGWSRAAMGENADVVVLVSIKNDDELARISKSMGESESVIVTDRFTVLSRRRIGRYALTQLDIAPGEGLDPRQRTGTRKWADPGHAMFIELAADDHRPAACVWVLDLPSDLSLARRDITAQAAGVIREFKGPALLPNSMQAWVEDGATVLRGFPEPDLIIGDFNIPRGSASLDAITRGKPNAFDQCGYGPTASWPCKWPRTRFAIWPVLHLDQMFTGRGLRATSYTLINPGSGTHRMQRADFVAAGP
ncbi:MAG: hypothetical protein U0638_10935 [Phycisphaerales bacterium]